MLGFKAGAGRSRKGSVGEGAQIPFFFVIYVCRIHYIYIDLASDTEADPSDPVIPTDSLS
jgi:hypothetical protein